ncbi:MAG TPA: YbaK/EbsC family protein [Terriglobales bacterium]|nr:YbaK/EbsC family protein [Terriglobales bacterium]
MSLSRIKDFLDTYHTKYIVITHSLAYTAQGIAALAHIPGQELAKTVILKVDNALAMAVVPASCQVDLLQLKRAAEAKSVELASEQEFRDRFPDCETGAMPPFGNLYGMTVYADETLTRDEEVAFNAGTHRELIRMRWADLQRLVHPVVLKLAIRATAQVA